ncbi:MAG: hypothetical protein KIT43_13615 [Bauldia sp.]|nr:hypothetical protein [Bauldia sp.]MCW5716939.1 hypothetical protein [Bauldia sp.]
MRLTSNPLLRVAMIGALALAAGPGVPATALAAGQTFERCESVEFQGNVLAPGRDTFFDGYVRVDHSGEFEWICWTRTGATAQRTDCGADGVSHRRARAELRGGVFYFGCA